MTTYNGDTIRRGFIRGDGESQGRRNGIVPENVLPKYTPNPEPNPNVRKTAFFSQGRRSGILHTTFIKETKNHPYCQYDCFYPAYHCCQICNVQICRLHTKYKYFCNDCYFSNVSREVIDAIIQKNEHTTCHSAVKRLYNYMVERLFPEDD